MEAGVRCTVNLRPVTFYLDVDRQGAEARDIALFREVAAACRREHGEGRLWWDADFIPDAPANAFTWVGPDGMVELHMTAVIRCGVYHEMDETVTLPFGQYRDGTGGTKAWDALRDAVTVECRRRLGPGVLRHLKANEFKWERF